MEDNRPLPFDLPAAALRQALCWVSWIQAGKIENDWKPPTADLRWTERKLKCLRDYLTAHRKIFTVNPKARYFDTWYVDAFAGTGSRSNRRATRSTLEGFFADAYEDVEAQEYQDGSAKIALALASPFDSYLFIEKSKARVAELQSVIQAEFPHLSMVRRMNAQP